MITVAQQISSLLYTNECVIVPGFGAFVCTNVSARFDADKNIFLPPSKEVGFNRSLAHNDGVLITSLAQANKQNYEQAKMSVSNFVHELLGQIKKGDSVTLDKIGTLKQDAMGNIQFLADSSESYLMESYGLQSFHFEPGFNQKQLNEEQQKVRRLLMPVTLKRIAASVAILVGLFALTPDMNKLSDQVKTESASTMNFLISSENSFNENAEDALDITEIASPQEEATNEENAYFLIAGSFKSENQAEKFLQEVKNRGEEQAFVLLSPNNRFRVALEGFSDKSDAIELLNAYRQKKHFKSVWILKQS